MYPVTFYIIDLRLQNFLNCTIRHPDIRVKHCIYGHSVATLLNPRGVATVPHKYSLTVARHEAVVVAVPFTVRYPSNNKTEIYNLR
jgi:hypothetical protein